MNIKPCYHCGKDKGYLEKTGSYSHVKCSSCKATGAYVKDGDTAVALWNRQYKDIKHTFKEKMKCQTY